jgi:hypothetical protein
MKARCTFMANAGGLAPHRLFSLASAFAWLDVSA